MFYEFMSPIKLLEIVWINHRMLSIQGKKDRGDESSSISR